MLVEAIAIISFAALFLYLLFGGADYGAGILEVFRIHKAAEEQEEIITDAIGPVWEANHIWLIVITVILFVGFPTIYTTLTNHLHIPLVALLLGIVVRGASFTYRHYDEYKGSPGAIYSWFFAFGSLWTSFWFGVIIGAATLGKIDPKATTAKALYIDPWCNSFSFAVGLFLCSLFAFLASTFLISEAKNDRMKKFFFRRSVASNIAMIQSGSFLFIAAEWSGLPLASKLLERPASLVMLVIAGILSWTVALLRRGKSIWTKILPATVAFCTVLGFYFIHRPALVVVKGGYLNFQNSAAPDATILQLLIALGAGLIFILPSLALLFWIFKFKSPVNVMDADKQGAGTAEAPRKIQS